MSLPRESEFEEAGPTVEEGDGWLGFLLACARYHELQEAPRTPIDDLRIFDNSTHRVDDHIRVLAQSARGWPQSYERYLELRMAAFAAQAAGGTIDMVSLLGEGEGDYTSSEAVETLRDLFHRQEPAESKALLRRLEQLPREAVIEEWYRPGEHFERWATAVTETARARERDQWSAFRDGGYTRLLRQLGDGADDNCAGVEHIQRRLARASHELSMHLRGEAGISHDAVEALGILEPVATPPNDETHDPSRSTLLRVSTGLAATNDTRGGDLLNAFVVELAKACQCEVCDFVSVEGAMLRPTVISDPASKLRELLEKPYRRAEGIAGSAVLLPASRDRRWVGTNDLSSDPRQSTYHTHSWSQATKSPIYDYWVFPVYGRDSGCFGAFRVFNRLRHCWENGTPWSEGMLWELREVAAWFEAAILPRVSESEVVPRTVTATAHSAPVQHLKADLGLRWIDEDFLVRVITHATQVAHRKVESMSLGCCLGIFGEPPQVLTHNPSYYAAGEVSFDPDDEARHLEDAAAAYPKINPAAGMFVFEPGGRGRGVISLRQSDSVSTLDALRRLSSEHPQSLLLFLDRAQDCIRLISGGELVADYYLSEASGEWALRMYRRLREHAQGNAPGRLPPEDVGAVLERAIDLSYSRIGAMLILGDGIPENVHCEHETPLTDVNLRSLSGPEFADMAASDGAVRIEPVKGVTAIGAIVRTAPIPETQANERPEGSRHSSAAAFSELAPDHMVFVVSENRALTVMVHGDTVVDGL